VKQHRPKATKGRGAVSNPPNRYASHHREAFDDGWDHGEKVSQSLQTRLSVERSRKVLSYNDSPDLPFDRSIYEAEFGKRMCGRGAYAELLMQRFRITRKRLGFTELPPLDCAGFVRPAEDPRQLSLL
jgi:hypothetical protein